MEDVFWCAAVLLCVAALRDSGQLKRNLNYHSSLRVTRQQRFGNRSWSCRTVSVLHIFFYWIQNWYETNHRFHFSSSIWRFDQLFLKSNVVGYRFDYLKWINHIIWNCSANWIGVYSASKTFAEIFWKYFRCFITALMSPTIIVDEWSILTQWHKSIELKLP